MKFLSWNVVVSCEMFWNPGVLLLFFLFSPSSSFRSSPSPPSLSSNIQFSFYVQKLNLKPNVRIQKLSIQIKNFSWCDAPRVQHFVESGAWPPPLFSLPFDATHLLFLGFLSPASLLSPFWAYLSELYILLSTLFHSAWWLFPSGSACTYSPHRAFFLSLTVLVKWYFSRVSWHIFLSKSSCRVFYLARTFS